MSAAESLDLEVDEQADTIRTPNVHTEELALELEKLEAAGLNKHNRNTSFMDGWHCGRQDCVDFVRVYGDREGRCDK